MPIDKQKIIIPGALKNLKNSNLFSFFLQFGVVAIIFFLVGFSFGKRQIGFDRKGFIPQITVSNEDVPEDQNIDFSLFWKVLDTLPEKYVDKSAVDGQKILYGAISGMVKSLGDPYTAFLDPKQNEAVKSELSGVYEGVGIQIGFNKDKRLTVIAPLSGTPADRAGVRPKDLILAIDDKDTFDLSLPEAVDKIRGTAGTKVKLKLQRDNNSQPYDVEVVREKITVKSVEVSYEQNGSQKVARMKVSRFGDTTDKEWDNAVDEVEKSGAGAIIVDMRNNPGGLLSSSIHLASEFVKGVVVKQEDSGGRVDGFSADHEGRFLKKPIVVLINGGSASAAEIFAGAIQDNKRGKVVGEKSFGKGTVQEPIELDGGSSLHVTVAKWLTPNGKNINEVGITPDIEVKADEEKPENDVVLSKALELLK